MFRKILPLLVIILIAIALVLLWPRETFQGREYDDILSKQKVSKEQVPRGLPGEIPLENEARVLENYEAKLTDGGDHATRVFQTSLDASIQSTEAELGSFDKIWHSYFEYLKNGWTITEQSGTDNERILAAVKDKTELHIIITKDPKANKLYVEVTSRTLP